MVAETERLKRKMAAGLADSSKLTRLSSETIAPPLAGTKSFFRSPGSLRSCALHLADDLVLLAVLQEVAEAPAGVGELQGAGDLLDRDPEFGGLVAVDRDDSFRAVHLEVGVDLAQHRALGGRIEEVRQHLRSARSRFGRLQDVGQGLSGAAVADGRWLGGESADTGEGAHVLHDLPVDFRLAARPFARWLQIDVLAGETGLGAAERLP